MSDLATVYINRLFSLIYNKITVPGDYHGRVSAVKDMLKDDVTGLVDSLTDFQVNSASVRFSIETDNTRLSEKYNNWLANINANYNGQIPRGINALAEEYFKERWKGSSFPVIKIAQWEDVDGLLLPSKMCVLDGGSIYSKDIDESQDIKSVIGYKYYLGRDLNDSDLLNKNVIITKPYGRWHDEFPVPYLIKRGVYHNYLIVNSLKNKQTDVLEQVIPYILDIKRGSEMLEKEGQKVSQKELENVISEFKTLVSKMSESTSQRRTTARASKWDETIEHLIPDLTKLFENSLFTTAEQNILAGLGLVDIAESISSSRREGVLNPKPFITETKKGVEDFKNYVIRESIYRIIAKNKEEHKKYMSGNVLFKVNSSPVSAFMTDKVKQELRLQWKNGQLSSRTYCEMVGEVEYEAEVNRRKEEAKKGYDKIMYPHLTINAEDKGIDLPNEPVKKETDKNGNTIPPDKLEDKEKFNMGKLEIAPYKNIKALPKSVKDNMTPSLQKTFLEVWNKSYKKYGNEKTAFKTAWSVIKRIGVEKNNKWIKK